MGAWGYHTFEDDVTCDWAYDLYNTEDPHQFLLLSLTQHLSDGYIEYDSCSSFLGAAETIYALLFHIRDNHPDNFKEWIQNNRDLKVADLKPMCVRSLNRVLSEKSELNELWSENEEDYSNWKNNIEVMLNAFK
ncbi:MAG: DUF4259 domain-containing protein [Gimesia sp.]|nr:DUF4259 domain-containing protein [Gimesia sp.]